MSDELKPASQAEDIGHEVGEHNVQAFGLDFHNPVFAVSAILAVSVVTGTLLFRDQAAQLFSQCHIGAQLGRFFSAERRHVERIGDAAIDQIIAQLLGHLQCHIDLRFIG